MTAIQPQQQQKPHPEASILQEVSQSSPWEMPQCVPWFLLHMLRKALQISSRKFRVRISSRHPGASLYVLRMFKPNGLKLLGNSHHNSIQQHKHLPGKTLSARHSQAPVSHRFEMGKTVQVEGGCQPPSPPRLPHKSTPQASRNQREEHGQDCLSMKDLISK